jgi:tripartite-type tricarboxylate transporter receptor subunit TctC
MKSWAVFAALAAGVSSGTVLASDYPSKPIVMIVPFAAGGPSDAVARITAQAMSQELGTQVLVDNVPGAGGTMARQRLPEQHPTDTRCCFTISEYPRRRLSIVHSATILGRPSLPSDSSRKRR